MTENELTFDLSEDRKRVMIELARIGFFDVRELFDFSGDIKHVKDWDATTGAAVSSLKVTDRETGSGITRTTEIKLNDKGSALEKLAKIMSLYADGGNSLTALVKGDVEAITQETPPEDASRIYQTMIGESK